MGSWRRSPLAVVRNLTPKDAASLIGASRGPICVSVDGKGTAVLPESEVGIAGELGVVERGWRADGLTASAFPVLREDHREAVAGYRPFALERWFARFEFTAPHLLCCSDCEPLKMKELLAMADAECAGMWDTLSLGYTESSGLPLLRKAIAESYGELDPDGVIVVCPEEGIFLAAHALLRSGDEVVVPGLCYQSLSEVARAIGCTIKTWNPAYDSSTGSWSFNVDDLQDLVGPQTRLVVANFPHNPTGCLLSPAELHRVADVCSKHGAYLFSDEMYRGLEHTPGSTLPSAVQLGYPRAMCLGGVSKTLSLPGLRMGWLASPDRSLLAAVQTLRDFTTICPPAPSEVLALMALRNQPIILKRNLELIASGKDRIRRLIDSFPQLFRAKMPSAGTTCFVELLGDTPSEAFCERLAAEAGVVLVPSSMFELPPGKEFLRFGFARKDVHAVCDIVEEHLSSHLPRYTNA